MKITVNEQIHLSGFSPADKYACLEHLNEREIYDRTLRIPYPYTEADFEAWLTMVEESIKRHGRPTGWAIRTQDGFLIGGCGFRDLELGKSHLAEIGYWLAKPYWGGGIMTAVVHKLCEIGFADFGLAKLTAHVFADNRASARVLEKCGFEQEGYLRKHYLKDGRLLDSRLYGLVKD
jgi:RimJ/RimL family protein N-acetyltransferase